MDSISPQRIGGPLLSPGEGTIFLLWGPMFAQKTTELLRMRKLYGVKYSSGELPLIKPSSDTRFNDDKKEETMSPAQLLERMVLDDGCTEDEKKLSHSCGTVRTHSNITDQGYTVDNLMRLVDSRVFTKGKIFFIDEGQFFKDLGDFCRACVSTGKSCIIAALHTDRNDNLWPPVTGILGMCADIKFLHGLCMLCDRASSFTRLRNHVDDPDSQELIGGEEEYMSLCPPCANAHKFYKEYGTDRCKTPPPVYSNGSSTRPPLPGAPLRNTSKKESTEEYAIRHPVPHRGSIGTQSSCSSCTHDPLHPLALRLGTSPRRTNSPLGTMIQVPGMGEEGYSYSSVGSAVGSNETSSSNASSSSSSSSSDNGRMDEWIGYYHS